MKVGGQPCEATRKNFSALGGKFLEEIGIFEVDGLGGDIKSTARHAAVGSAEIGAALRCLGYAHGVLGSKNSVKLFGFAMECVAAKIGIILPLFEATRSIQALLVAGRRIARGWLPFGNSFGAFKGDDVAWHKNSGDDVNGDC